MKNFIIALIIIILFGLGIYMLTRNKGGSPTDQGVSTTTPINQVATSTTSQPNTAQTVIGTSVEGRDIVAYHFGTGSTEILLVGGIHGGYSWNTSLLAYQTMDYLKANPNIIPANVKITVIPVLNPDGLNRAVGTSSEFTQSNVSESQSVLVASRFNAHKVDLSRNFDCDWQAKGVWQTQSVSGGSSAFSEPESLAVKKYIESHNITAAVVWYSSAGGVYASSCGGGILPETATITNIYAKASGYPAYESYDFYETTGDMVNWLAKKNIPAISVLLTTHADTELDKNMSGIQALLQHYAQ
jgi:carboxypeptidase T